MRGEKVARVFPNLPLVHYCLDRLTEGTSGLIVMMITKPNKKLAELEQIYSHEVSNGSYLAEVNYCTTLTKTETLDNSADILEFKKELENEIITKSLAKFTFLKFRPFVIKSLHFQATRAQEK